MDTEEKTVTAVSHRQGGETYRYVESPPVVEAIIDGLDYDLI